jgi:hypothetical protein
MKILSNLLDNLDKLLEVKLINFNNHKAKNL